MISPSSNAPDALDSGLAAEPLRALRRGLTHGHRFALYIAVVKSPAQRNQLITLLGEAMPTAKLQTVTLRPDSTDILDEVQRQLGGKFSGPIMIVGLDEVIASDTVSHPILNALNLRRPDWPQLVPQAVVLWVPESLLGVLARVTPDFLDWRSDTLHFPDLQPAEFQTMQSATWDGGMDTRMPVQARLERIKELKSRVAANEHSPDPVVRSALISWLNELGLHLLLLGRTREALDCFQKELVIAREMGDRRDEGTAIGNLGIAYKNLGDALKAIEFHEQQLKIVREIGDRRGEGNALGNLGNAHYILGDARKAIEFFEQCLVLHREIGDRRGEGNALWNSALSLDKLGERAQAIARAEDALQIYETIEDPNAAKVRTTLAEWRAAK